MAGDQHFRADRALWHGNSRVDPQQSLPPPNTRTAQTGAASKPGSDNPTPDSAEAMDFVGTVLADTEDTWSQIFQQQLGTTICSTEAGDVFQE